MRVFEVPVAKGKKTVEVVAGLEWHPLLETGSARSKELLGYARETEADLKLLRINESVQVGLAKKAEGAKKGQISAAALIASELSVIGAGRNSLVALQIPTDLDNFIYIVIRDGIILADGDQVASRDEIRSSLTESFAYGGWDTVVCPGEWGVTNSLEHDFSFYINERTLAKPKNCTLEELQPPVIKIAVLILLLVAVAFSGIYGYQIWAQKKAAQAFILQQQMEEAARGQRPAAAHPVKPWPQMAGVESFAEACNTALRSVGLDAGNWQLKQISCTAGTLTVRWEKSGESAWISHLKSTRPNAVIAQDGLSASVTVPAVAPSSGLLTEVLLPQADARLRLYDLASRYSMSVAVGQVIAPPAPVVLPGQTAPPVMPLPTVWQEIPFTAVTTLAPTEVALILQSPGLRIKQIDSGIRSGSLQHTFIGVQYVQP